MSAFGAAPSSSCLEPALARLARPACMERVSFALPPARVLLVGQVLPVYVLHAPALTTRRARMAERLAAFEKYYTWIDPDGLAYFRARLEQAPRDSEHALEVVTQYCRTPQDRDAAVAALSFKCDVLWSMMDAIEKAHPA